MKNLKFYTLIFLIGMPSITRAQKENIESLLQKLDSVVTNHSEYIQKKKTEITNFKQALETSTNNYNKYEICSHLYHEYMKFDSDSALTYAYRCQELATIIGQKDMFIRSKINEMLIMAYRGEYIEVNNIMKEYGPIENIPPQLQFQYAVACLEYYLRANTQKKNDRYLTDSTFSDLKTYWNIYQSYIPCDHWKHDYYEVIIADHPIEEKIIKRLENVKEPSFQAAMLQFTLAKIYKQKGEEELYFYYLVNSAINDISMANREMQSLLELIQSPYLKKDNQRAINYAMPCYAMKMLKTTTIWAEAWIS